MLTPRLAQVIWCARWLAGECRAHGWKTVLCGNVPHLLSKKLVVEGHGMVVLENGASQKLEGEFMNAIKSYPKQSWVVLDGYHFGTEYQQAVLEKTLVWWWWTTPAIYKTM
jgi:hypothetical protein